MKSIKISDYMNKRPVTFRYSMTIAEATERFIQSNQIGGPVIDENRHVIGFLSQQDCLIKMLEATYLNESHSRVEDVMRAETLTVSPDGSVLDLAQRMTGAKPKLYPVVDEYNVLLGIITRLDILKAIDIQLHSMYEEGHDRLV